MAEVSLDGLRIEVEHASSPHEVTERLEAFARDLAENRFSEWGVRVMRDEQGRLQLAGRREGTHFDATVEPQNGQAVVWLVGRVEIGRLKLTMAGGPDGVRRRVADEVRRALERHLAP